ncbi:MAG: EI24 domain-containing protein [Proteobacteria bacterium]|nr:EI24 domain-containing protein [Pseudomonadota bacterium]
MMIGAASEFATGARGFWRGVQWLVGHPSMLLLLVVPWLFGLFAFAGGIYVAWTLGDSWVSSVLLSWFASWQDEWGLSVLYIVIKGLVWFSILLLSLVGAVVIAGVVASPVYEVISVRIERELLGEQYYRIPWARMPGLLFGEACKAMLVLSVPLMMLLIPGVNLVAGVAAAFLLGWDFYDYPLARRGWSLRDRWNFVRSEFWTVLGFGIWLAIPVVQMVLVPMAVAGGTILNVEALKRRGFATAQIKQGGSL